MSLLIDIVYLFVILIASPWLIVGAFRQGKYREGHAAKLLGLVPRREGARPCAWFHAVSVGEVNLLKTIVDRFESSFPDWDLVISTTTKSGFDLARTKYANRVVFYCPLDFSWAVGAALRRVRPNLLVLAELELWPNLIRTAKRRGCRIAIVNGRLSERSARGYRWLWWMVAPLLRSIDVIAAQNDEYAARFRILRGAPPLHGENVHVTGSVKFDGARTERGNDTTQQLARLANIKPEDLVFLAGSTQGPEESFAVETYGVLRKEFTNLRLILVPRHTTRCDEIAGMLDRSGLAWQRRSSLEFGVNANARILLVDTVGELGAWWGTAQIGFVGGSMGRRGGQNMIEPAAYGVAVSFGPNTSNFRDIVALLLQHDAAIVVRDGDALTQFVRRCLEQPSWANALGQRAQQLAMQQQGATDRTMALLKPLISANTVAF